MGSVDGLANRGSRDHAGEAGHGARSGTRIAGTQRRHDSPYDSADGGVAVFRQDLENFKTPAKALAAYYQGPTSLRTNGPLPDTQQYVQGILDLAARMTS